MYETKRSEYKEQRYGETNVLPKMCPSIMSYFENILQSV